MTAIKLRSMKLVNYKGFSSHTITFRHTNVLVGANNAGKSTALGALRLLASMLPQARRVRPNGSGEVDGRVYSGWTITAQAIENSAFSPENVRHDFLPLETRVEVLLTSGVRLVASWDDIRDYDADETPPGGAFFVFPADGGPIMQPRKAAQDLTPEVAVVPTLTPLDDREGISETRLFVVISRAVALVDTSATRCIGCGPTSGTRIRPMCTNGPRRSRT